MTTKEALPFVNIGIRHKNIGTVSSESGKFSINIPEQNLKDTITFSSVGYRELSIAIEQITKSTNFALSPLPVKLNEVTIATKKLKKQKHGLHKYRPILHFLDGSTNQDDIFEIAQIIKLDKKRSKITSINLHINAPRKDSGTFRINFYSYEGNRPAKRLIEKSIVQTHAIKPGWLHFDIAKYSIYLSGTVVVGVEFIPTGKKNNTINYEIKPGGRSKSFVRTSSLGSWQVPPHQYRMFVTALGTDEKNDRKEEEEKEAAPSFTLYSESVKDSFFIFTRLPKSYRNNPQRNYPIVYILDANLFFNFMSDSLDKSSNDEIILAGIGYKNFVVMDSLRDRDYTYPPAHLSDSMKISGGGKKFYEFIRKELTPHIDRLYRVDSTRRILMGHSLGGYFTLFALHTDLVNNHRLFKNYIAASPSVEYRNQYLLKQFRELKSPGYTVPKTVFITSGSLEDDEEEINGEKYSTMINAFVHQLSKESSIKLNSHIYPYAAHMETALPSFYTGLLQSAK